MASVVFLHGVGGTTPGWASALQQSVKNAGCDDDFEVLEVDFRDLLARPGVIRRRAVSHRREPIVRRHARDELVLDYRTRQRALRLDVWDSPDRVAGPKTKPPILVPGEIMVRLPILGMREAGHYRHDDQVRSAVLDRVASRIHQADGPVVVLAHSLGSVVALDALHVRSIHVDLLLSVGSPLGLSDFWGKAWESPATFPYDRLGGWMNVVNVRDPVVWGRGAQHRFSQTFDAFIDEGDGLTGPNNFHDASTYASSELVGRAVASAFESR